MANQPSPTFDLAALLCPSCGEFFDKLILATGFCRRCTNERARLSRWSPGSSLVVGICKEKTRRPFPPEGRMRVQIPAPHSRED